MNVAVHGRASFKPANAKVINPGMMTAANHNSDRTFDNSIHEGTIEKASPYKKPVDEGLDVTPRED